MLLRMALGLTALCLLACNRPKPSPRSTSKSVQEPPATAPQRAPRQGQTRQGRTRQGRHSNAAWRFPEAAQIVAIGDVHGDLEATRAALRLAGAIDEHDRWIGKRLVVVQTGDQLDRGDHEREILDLFERLTKQAAAAGGAFHALLGNHEIMNVAGDFRYVTPGGFAAFADIEQSGSVYSAHSTHSASASSPRVARSPAAARLPKAARGRGRAFFPGGPYARTLAKRNTIIVVGQTAFAHGGILSAHAQQGIANINAEVRAWIEGRRKTPPPIVTDPESPVWTRRYSMPNPTQADCAELRRTLRMLNARRMVVGHTVQKAGITSACNKQIWRIDVGLSAHYGGRTEVLAIEGNRLTILHSKSGRRATKVER